MDRIGRITQQTLASARMVETVATNLDYLSAELESAVGTSDAINEDAEDDAKEYAGQADYHAEQQSAPD